MSLKKALKVEKKLVAQMDDELQATLLRIAKARDEVIAQFQKSDHFSDLLFTQYFKGFKLLRKWLLKHQSEAIDLSALDFEVMDIKMIANEAQEEERRAAEEFAYVLTEIETEVEVEKTAVKAEVVAAAGGGDATNEGVDGQTITASTDHPSGQAQFLFISIISKL